MLTKKVEKVEMKKSNIIAECDLVIGTGVITADGIFHVIIRSGEKVTADTIKLGNSFMERVGGTPYLNLFEFEAFADVDTEVRKWAADQNGNQYTKADAIVVSSLPQKILADFYLKFNRPAKPTKIFRDRQKAIDWLKSL